VRKLNVWKVMLGFLFGILLTSMLITNTLAWKDKFEDGDYNGWEVAICDSDHQSVVVETTSSPYSRHLYMKNDGGICYLHVYSPKFSSPIT